MKTFTILVAFAMMAGSAVLSAQQLTDDQIRQLLLNQPPAAAVTDAQSLANKGVLLPIEVRWIRGNLDGSGLFQFLIAQFAVQNLGSGYLRVFQQQGGVLLLKGDQEQPQGVPYGLVSNMGLVDVNNDGIPEVIVESVSHNAKDHVFFLFSWTGSALHDMFGGAVHDGQLTDLNGDGILEIVATDDKGQTFHVYKLSGTNYSLVQTVTTDPTGLAGADGNINFVRAFCSTLDPGKFRLSDILKAMTSTQQNGSVHFRFGGLNRFDGSQVDVAQVDQSTIQVEPNLRLLSVVIQNNGSTKADSPGCQKALPARMDVQISRTDLLKSLQRLKLVAPLAVGDQVQIKLNGKLVDGTPFSAVFEAGIQ